MTQWRWEQQLKNQKYSAGHASVSCHSQHQSIKGRTRNSRFCSDRNEDNYKMEATTTRVLDQDCHFSFLRALCSCHGCTHNTSGRIKGNCLDFCSFFPVSFLCWCCFPLFFFGLFVFIAKVVHIRAATELATATNPKQEKTKNIRNDNNNNNNNNSNARGPMLKINKR